MSNYAFEKICPCHHNHELKMIVLTGGPGAGKTAVLETLKRIICDHVSILPEAATILFSGGFWRHDTDAAKRAAQRAIFHVQNEIEKIVIEENKSALAICDRGTLDGLAYWNESESLFWESVGSTKDKELLKYSKVIHLRTPSLSQGYNRLTNDARIEDVDMAMKIDEKIVKVWEGHPNRCFVGSKDDFFEKISEAIKMILSEIPLCCNG